MPQSLKEWIELAFVGFLFLIPSMSKADDIMECVSKGRLAASMVYTVAEGYELEKINVNFSYPPRNKQDADERDAYVSNLKKEVAVLLEGRKPALDKEFAARIGLQVTEKCAVEYGEKSGKFKRTASSEGIVDGKVVRDVECGEILKDHEIIATHAKGGAKERVMVEKATRDKGVDDERWAKILKLIREAHSYEGGVEALFVNAWSACVDGK